MWNSVYCLKKRFQNDLCSNVRGKWTAFKRFDTEFTVIFDSPKMSLQTSAQLEMDLSLSKQRLGFGQL